MNSVGIKFDETTFDFAAKSGNIECIKFSHKISCPYRNDICYNAIQNGNVEILKYIYKIQLFPTFSSCVFINTVQNGYIDCIKFLHEINWLQELTIYDINELFINCNKEITQFLIDNKYIPKKYNISFENYIFP